MQMLEMTVRNRLRLPTTMRKSESFNETSLESPSRRHALNRRQMIKSLALAGGCALAPAGLFGGSAQNEWHPKPGDEAFLDDLQRQACLFFWEQASEKTGQVLDRARNDLNGRRDPRRMAQW